MNHKIKKPLLEIAVFSWQGLEIAATYGADRIELCDNPQDGGTTPSFGMMQKATETFELPIYPIIRPRGGHFVYSEEECEIMLHDIVICRQIGIKGIVCGKLLPSGELDVEFMKRCRDSAGSMEITFHRAFDRCIDPWKAMESLIRIGIQRILTSGQFPDIMQGYPLVKQLIEIASNRIIIMPGSGLNSRNLSFLHEKLHASEYHTAARIVNAEDRIYTSPTMANDKMEYVSVSKLELSALRQCLDTMKIL